MRRFLLIGSLLACLLNLSGCIYRPDVQQGNRLADKDIRAIHVGMSRSELISMFGAPLLVNLYDYDRVIYVYTFKRNRKEMQETRVFVYLHNDRVTNFWTDKKPPARNL